MTDVKNIIQMWLFIVKIVMFWHFLGVFACIILVGYKNVELFAE